MINSTVPEINCASQRGAALIVSLIVLLVVTLLGLSSMESALMQERMASNSQNENQAFQTTESLLADALPDKAADISDEFEGLLNDAFDRVKGDEGDAKSFSGAASPVSATYEIIYMGEVRFTRVGNENTLGSPIKTKLYELKMSTTNADTQAAATHTQGFTLN